MVACSGDCTRPLPRNKLLCRTQFRVCHAFEDQNSDKKYIERLLRLVYRETGSARWHQIQQDVEAFPSLTSCCNARAAKLSSVIEYFYSAQLKAVHTAPWPHCPNKNVFGNCRNWPYDSPHSLRLGGTLFQTCGPAAAKVPSPKLLRDQLTTSVRVSAERSCLSDELTIVGQVTRALPDKDRWTRLAILNTTRCCTGSQCRRGSSSCVHSY